MASEILTRIHLCSSTPNPMSLSSSLSISWLPAKITRLLPPSFALSLLTFSVKDLDSLHYFLEVEVVHTSDSIFLSQHKYIHGLLSKTNMLGAKEVTTPMSSTVSLCLNDNSAHTNATESPNYRCSPVPLPHPTRHLLYHWQTITIS